MSDSPKFQYPELSDQQDSAEITHNLGNRRTEALLGNVLNRTQQFPTGSEAEGTAYIVKDGLGQFSGFDDYIVFLSGGNWEKIAPVEGQVPIYVVAEKAYVYWDGATWVPLMTDWFTQIQLGNIPGHSVQHPSARNESIPNGSWAPMSLGGLNTRVIATPVAVRIKSGGSAADTAAGAGARSVIVRGVDSALNVIEETIATAGGSASAPTTALFWRINSVRVGASGTYGGANVGSITIEDAGGANDLIQIAAGDGKSQHGEGTVPGNAQGQLLGALITIDGNQAADVRGFIHEEINDTSVPVSAPRQFLYIDGVKEAVNWIPRAPIPVGPMTTIWFEARGSGGGTEGGVDFEILIVADNP